MNDNIDDWLNTLGLSQNSNPSEIPVQPPTLPTEVQPSSIEEPAPQALSEDDFNDILSNLGLPEVQEAEVVTEETDMVSSEEQSDNSDDDEGNLPLQQPQETAPDLDSEEDAEWEERIQSGELTPLIPPNSPTLLIDDSTSRFSGAEWFNEIRKQEVIIAGCGGIGSNAAFQIARMSLNTIMLYDDDRVERANMSGQLFGIDDVGRYKVDAIANMIYRYTSTHHIYSTHHKFEANSQPADVMICGFDNMAARKTFFEAWCRHIKGKSLEDRKKCLFLDGRLSIDTLQVLCIRGDDEYNIKRYSSEFLFSDAEAEETVCSMKQTTYLACMIASFMTNLFTNFVAGQLDPIIPYHLPFFTEYNSQLMMLKLEN